MLLFLLGAAGLLLIACTNILNLFLSRLMLLQKQLAIRAALGARRIQLGQQLFTEALLLMLLSAAGWHCCWAQAGFSRFKPAGLAGFFPRSQRTWPVSFYCVGSALMLALVTLAVLHFSCITAYCALSSVKSGAAKQWQRRRRANTGASFAVVLFCCNSELRHTAGVFKCSLVMQWTLITSYKATAWV